MTIVTAHGFNFNVEGDGFVRAHASDDFERGMEAVADYLNKMPATDVAALHAASMAWVAVDCAGDRPAILDAVEDAAHRVATRDWRSPEAVIISVSAAK